MNELIERLAFSSGLISLDGFHATAYESNIEAFARAVARECAEIAERCDDTDQAYRVIRERFGI